MLWSKHLRPFSPSLYLSRRLFSKTSTSVTKTPESSNLTTTSSHRSKAIKSLHKDLTSENDTMLNKFTRNHIEKIGTAMDSLLYKYEEKEVPLSEAQKMDMRHTAIIKQGNSDQGLKLADGKDRNLYTEGNELAEKFIKGMDNGIDFYDERVKVTGQKSSTWRKQVNADLVQIDLGKVKSLRKDQVTKDKVDLDNLPEDVQIIDEEEKNIEYDLLLVGRKMSPEERANYQLTASKTDDKSKDQVKHFINKEMFHEQDLSHLDKGVQKDEGAVKYFSRNILKVILTFWLAGTLLTLYSFQTSFFTYYEDYVDYMIYYNFKRGRTMEYMTTITYRINALSLNK